MLERGGEEEEERGRRWPGEQENTKKRRLGRGGKGRIDWSWGGIIGES